jgi:hypothetical protein
MIIREANDVLNEAFKSAKKYINGDPEGDYRKYLETRTHIYKLMQEEIYNLIYNENIYIDKKKLTDFDEFLKNLISNSPDDQSQLESYIKDKLFNYLVSTANKKKVSEIPTNNVEDVKNESVEKKVENVPVEVKNETVEKKVETNRENGIDDQEAEARKLIENIRNGINYDDNISKLFKMYVDMLKNIVYKHPGLAEFKVRDGSEKELIPGSVYIDPKIEDVISETIEPFMKAIKDFNLKGSTKFSTFLYTYVDQYLKNMYTTKQRSKLRQESEFEFILTRGVEDVDKLDDDDVTKLMGLNNITNSKIVDNSGNEYKKNNDYTFDGKEIKWVGKKPKEGEEYKIIFNVSNPSHRISFSDTPPFNDEESKSMTYEEIIPDKSVDIQKLLESNTDEIRKIYARSVGYNIKDEDKEMEDLLSLIWADINLEREEKDLSDQDVKDIILKMVESSEGIKLSDLDLNNPEEKVLYDELMSSIDKIFDYLRKENMLTTSARKKMIFFDLILDYNMDIARRIMEDRFHVSSSTLTEWLSRYVNPSIADAFGLEYYTPKLSIDDLIKLFKESKMQYGSKNKK